MPFPVCCRLFQREREMFNKFKVFCYFYWIIRLFQVGCCRFLKCSRKKSEDSRAAWQHVWQNIFLCYYLFLFSFNWSNNRKQCTAVCRFKVLMPNKNQETMRVPYWFPKLQYSQEELFCHCADCKFLVNLFNNAEDSK